MAGERVNEPVFPEVSAHRVCVCVRVSVHQ